ncbi:MAG TPA: ABC transporter permease [Polyangia bacterium]|jgi:phospholipid/cholesterol/gamma-HCH transport system permease protein|nr:ABC transporter permease [Polyangia bacterium]
MGDPPGSKEQDGIPSTPAMATPATPTAPEMKAGAEAEQAPAAPQERRQRQRERLERWGRYTDALWRPLLNLIEVIGAHLLLLGQVVFWTVRRPYRVRIYFEAMDFVGVGSLLIVALVGTFVGMVFSLQSVSAFRQFQAESFVGSTVALALTRELAPVFTSIMVAARAGSAMATELGSMRITEQIDALATLAINPVQYLVAPRIVAATVMAPFLAMVFNVVGMLGAYAVAVGIEGVDRGVFIERTRWFLDANDIAQGLVKAVVFGLALSLISCYQGFFAGGGAKGVGIATTRAVVGSFVTILVLDYFLTDIWLTLFSRVNYS